MSVDLFKLLGVDITEHLSWAARCDYVIMKANRGLCALRNVIKSGVHPGDLVLVYCFLVRSVLEYAAAAFANIADYLANDIIYLSTKYEGALAKG